MAWMHRIRVCRLVTFPANPKETLHETRFAVQVSQASQGRGTRNGARLPIAEAVDGFYAEVVAKGGKRWDTSSLMSLLAED